MTKLDTADKPFSSWQAKIEESFTLDFIVEGAKTERRRPLIPTKKMCGLLSRNVVLPTWRRKTMTRNIRMMLNKPIIMLLNCNGQRAWIREKGELEGTKR